jgi:hypothetical protein
MQKLITALAAVLLVGMGAFSVAVGDAQRGPRPAQPGADRPGMDRPAQPGTWQIVPGDRYTFLLNTATGQSFRLDGVEGRLFWEPIQGPGMEGRERRFGPERPERAEQRLADLRARMKEARGEERERIERAIEELERTREDRRPGREPGPEDIEHRIKQIEEEIGDLKHRFKESDSVSERERLEKAIHEHAAEADRLRKELKQHRR